MKVTEVQWNDSLSIPIYVLEDGRKFMPMTGQFAGYYEELNKSSIAGKYGLEQVNVIKPIPPSPSPSTSSGGLFTKRK